MVTFIVRLLLVCNISFLFFSVYWSGDVGLLWILFHFTFHCLISTELWYYLVCCEKCTQITAGNYKNMPCTWSLFASGANASILFINCLSVITRSNKCGVSVPRANVGKLTRCTRNSAFVVKEYFPLQVRTIGISEQWTLLCEQKNC